MKTLPSYQFRMLALAFWIIAVLSFKDSGASRFLFGHSLSWLVCVTSIFILWVLSVFIRVYGIKIVPKLAKDIAVSFIKQLPFLLVALGISLALIVIGMSHSLPILIYIGSVTASLSIWVIDWPEKEWYKPRKNKR